MADDHASLKGHTSKDIWAAQIGIDGSKKSSYKIWWEETRSR